MVHSRPEYNTIQDASGRIPDDEPVFLLRGQDVCTPPAMRAWIDAARSMGALPDILELAEAWLKHIAKWQSQPGILKTPDIIKPVKVHSHKTQHAQRTPDDKFAGIANDEARSVMANQERKIRQLEAELLKARTASGHSTPVNDPAGFVDTTGLSKSQAETFTGETAAKVEHAFKGDDFDPKDPAADLWDKFKDDEPADADPELKALAAEFKAGNEALDKAPLPMTALEGLTKEEAADLLAKEQADALASKQAEGKAEVKEYNKDEISDDVKAAIPDAGNFSK